MPLEQREEMLAKYALPLWSHTFGEVRVHSGFQVRCWGGDSVAVIRPRNGGRPLPFVWDNERRPFENMCNSNLKRTSSVLSRFILTDAQNNATECTAGDCGAIAAGSSRGTQQGRCRLSTEHRCRARILRGPGHVRRYGLTTIPLDGKESPCYSVCLLFCSLSKI